MPYDKRAVDAALGHSSSSLVGGTRIVLDDDPMMEPVDPATLPEWDQAAYDALVAEHEASTLTTRIREEVQRRIFERASGNTQINMAAARAADQLTEEQNAAYLDALTWVNAMRAKGRELTAANDETYADDVHWPEPSAEALALAAAF